MAMAIGSQSLLCLSAMDDIIRYIYIWMIYG